MIEVKMFAAAADAVAAGEVQVELSPPCSVGQVLEALGRDFPILEALLLRSRIAIDQSFASPEQIIERADQEIALIPPVSGG